jgi:hypothetical protein
MHWGRRMTKRRSRRGRRRRRGRVVDMMLLMLNMGEVVMTHQARAGQVEWV